MVDIIRVSFTTKVADFTASRPDRDERVRVRWENILPGREHNFQWKFGSTLNAYDYASVMHYSPFAFSRNGQPTITRLDGSTAGLQASIYLSAGDIAALQALYVDRPPPPESF